MQCNREGRIRFYNLQYYEFFIKHNDNCLCTVREQGMFSPVLLCGSLGHKLTRILPQKPRKAFPSNANAD